MANKQRKKQKKAPQQAGNAQARRQPTNQAGQAIEFEFGGNESPQPISSAHRCLDLQREDILTKMSEAGYHRARVRQMSYYERIVGGIVWAMYMFDKCPRGQEWFYVECGPGETKCDRERGRECAQILVVKEDLAFRRKILLKDLLEVNPIVLRPFVDYLISEIGKLDETKFGTLHKFFDSTFESHETAIRVFLNTLHRPNSLYACDMPHTASFDFSILRDELVSGKAMLYEYENYAFYGKRTYPGIFETCGVRKFAERIGPEHTKLRAQMDEMADSMVRGIGEEVLDNFRHMANMIDHLRFGYKIIDIECRFLDQASAFHKLNLQYREFSTKFAFLGDTVDEIHPLTADAMQKVIDAVMQRWAKLEKAQLLELTERQKRAYNLRRNHDEYDPEVYWHPDNGEKARIMEKENDDFEKYIADGQEFPNDMITVYCSFQSFCEVRDKSVPVEKEGYNFGLIPHVDNSLASNIAELMRSVDEVVDELETIVPAVDSFSDMIYRRALTTYLADCKNLCSDWYWKAKIVTKARTELCEKFKALKTHTKLSHHKLYYAEREASLLMRLNHLVRENEKELKRREKLVHIFNVDWNKKKERKATREAAIAAAKEQKRQQALEAARAAKQAKHAKNGNGKKGGSGKKGRHGARR